VKEIKEDLVELGRNYPKNFIEKRNNIFLLSFVVAQRKAFLRTDRLTYQCRLKVDDNKKEIIFFEILKESGAGVSTGGADDFGSGFGFKVEKVRINNRGRHGTVKEQSTLFGKKYNYEFNFEKIRQDVESIAEKYGFNFSYVLNERLVR